MCIAFDRAGYAKTTAFLVILEGGREPCLIALLLPGADPETVAPIHLGCQFWRPRSHPGTTLRSDVVQAVLTAIMPLQWSRSLAVETSVSHRRVTGPPGES